MPRLTQPTYIRQRDYLTKLRHKDPSAFTALPPASQSDLHLYYALNRDLEPSELVRHREAMTREDPSLPHRAGKALRRLQHNKQAGPITRHGQMQRRLTSERRGSVSVRPTLRSEPDLEALTEAVLLQLGLPETSETVPAPHSQTDGTTVVQGLQRQIRELQQHGTCTWSEYLKAIAHCHISWIAAREYSQLIAREGVSVGGLLPERDRPVAFRKLNEALVELSDNTSRAEECWKIVFDILVEHRGEQ